MESLGTHRVAGQEADELSGAVESLRGANSYGRVELTSLLASHGLSTSGQVHSGP
jgi:hypothetical protein